MIDLNTINKNTKFLWETFSEFLCRRMAEEGEEYGSYEIHCDIEELMVDKTIDQINAEAPNAVEYAIECFFHDVNWETLYELTKEEVNK